MFQGPSTQTDGADVTNSMSFDVQLKALKACSTQSSDGDRRDAAADLGHQPAYCNKQESLQSQQVGEVIQQQVCYNDHRQQGQEEEQQEEQEVGHEQQLDLDDTTRRWSTYDPLLQFQVIAEQARQRQQAMAAEQTPPASHQPAAAVSQPANRFEPVKPAVTAAAADKEIPEETYVSVAARKNAYIAAAQKIGSAGTTAPSEHPDYELSLAALRSSFMAAAAAAPNSATATGTLDTNLGSLAARKSTFLSALETSTSVTLPPPPAALTTPGPTHRRQVYLSKSCDGSAVSDSTCSVLEPAATRATSSAPIDLTLAAQAAPSETAPTPTPTPTPAAAAVAAADKVSLSVAGGWNYKTRQVAEMAAALLQSHSGQLEATLEWE